MVALGAVCVVRLRIRSEAVQDRVGRFMRGGRACAARDVRRVSAQRLCYECRGVTSGREPG
jgi:hypothetical protein